MVLSAPADMRPGGRALLLAQTLANNITHSLLLSCSACMFFCSSYSLRLKVLLLLATRPIAKPFSSILYVLAARTLYWSILECKRVK